ncbi:MAG: hypothetical protein LC647_16810, partial [Beggiatoa sp.]|nr:hypothetical protein [Beggiatoa sp.]
MENDSGRADVVGEVESFVHREEIEAGTGADDGSRGIGQGCGGLSDVRRGRRTPMAFALETRLSGGDLGRATTLHRSHGLV